MYRGRLVSHAERRNESKASHDLRPAECEFRRNQRTDPAAEHVELAKMHRVDEIAHRVSVIDD